MIITDYFLGMVFGEANQYIGSEDVLHVMLYNNFINNNFSPLQVAREQTLSTPSTRIDLVVYDKSFTEAFKNTQVLPLLAIEVKGGAHGITNALKVKIDSKGYCSDMDKLEKEVKRGIESWFICVDMPKLGGKLSVKLVEKVQKQCEQRGISFTYFSQGEEDFYYAPYGKEPSYEPINSEVEQGIDPHINQLLNKDNKQFIDTCNTLLEVNGHEANSVATLYRFFRESGLNVSQISLETYFSCAKTGGSSMPDRPDIVLFDKKHDGVFNLFKNGKRELSNDKHKISNLNTLIEVKGSDSVNVKNEQQRFEIYKKDVLKLSSWHDLLGEVGVEKEFSTCFIAIDRAKSPLSEKLIEQLLTLNDNKVIYICFEGVYIS